ncbi:F0F1 ATP synthase subunit A [Planosporangium thailandense]|uniref:ATP synthase subunit a n=1 Tax=Planosporangium thailandense TaxID=765197 RepID=A0ABX0Y3N6_9ACTN|nr:F0F1 ATP synthase subunit A [Planosporangium thailandense]NJC73006.1 F0F1 ATP synthase subunit A [Planosporangium thailandense]
MTAPATFVTQKHWPPSVDDFFPPSLGGQFWISKITVLLWIGIAAVIVFFLVAYRRPAIVPTRSQWIAESLYGLIRDGVAREVIGAEGLRFAPYLTSLFCFVAVTNLFGVIPLAQISPNSHMAFPAFLALISYVLYHYVGIRRFGLRRYLRQAVILPGTPKAMYPLLVPLEILQKFINQPFTLAIRLFSNMFAGHLILLVFTLGGFMLVGAQTVALRPVSLVSWAMALVLTVFEAGVALLQAYVFVLLTASYVQAALSDEH